jgi:hypothetical protein
MRRGWIRGPNGLRASLEAVTIEYPPPDPDGRPYIYYHFEGGDWPEWDFGESVHSVREIKEQQLEVSEGLKVVGYYDDGDEWCSSTRSWTGSIRKAATVVAGSHASIGRRSVVCQSPVDNNGQGHSVGAQLGKSPSPWAMRAE